MALAEAHDLLTQDNWNGATASDIVAAIVRTHDTSGRARFHVDGQPVRLKPHLALSLTMTLHELATNAIKYGALSNDTGSVDVSWGVEDGEEPLFRFAWRERGGPPVREPTRRGFGSRLIENQLRSEPGAQLETLYHVDGLQFRFAAHLGRFNEEENPAHDDGYLSFHPVDQF